MEQERRVQPTVAVAARAVRQREVRLAVSPVKAATAAQVAAQAQMA